MVDHDAQLALNADWLVDLGPGPGAAGGRLLYSGPPAGLLDPDGPDTPTRRWLLEESGAESSRPPVPSRECELFTLDGLSCHTVVDVSLSLRLRAVNLVTGIAGAGKTSLLAAAVERLRTDGPFQRIVTVDADPIGRTPRSNPATYTGAFDQIRDLFAATPEARALGFGKGHFSFNTAGGRCESCEGAGVHEVGMRYLGSVDLVCGSCAGRRFHSDVLAVRLDGQTVADVLAGSIEEAAARFRGHRKLARTLDALVDLGLGYLPLGQSATTLSGGEAQRIKLATELAKATSPALVVLDEPTTGLHAADVKVLVAALERLCAAGHTLLVADHDLVLVRAADRITELGPGSGPDGGRVVVAGTVRDLVACAEAPTGAALRGGYGGPSPAVHGPREDGRGAEPDDAAPLENAPLTLSGVTTHNLRDVTVAFPAPGFTVVTGPSGSGKSSLVFDTLLAESQARFADLVSPWARRFLPMRGGAELESARDLRAAVAVPAQPGRRNPRATVGTVTEVDELLRLLFARAGFRPCPRCGREASGPACACGERLEPLWAADFSLHTERGACPACRGLGFAEVCDPSRLVSRPDLPLDGGALGGTRFGAYLAEPDGQHVATLRAAAEALGVSVSGPWRDLAPAARQLAMEGAGERLFEVDWSYRRGKRSGVHRFESRWAGFARLVEAEYGRVHADERGEELEPLLVDRPCASCDGEKLRPAARGVTLAGLRAPEAARQEADALAAWLDGLEPGAVTNPIRADLRRRVQALCDAGLGYLAPERELATLSGGEAQRVRLAAALGGGLVGVTYVLDEPTQGLHARDTARLAALLRGLSEAGNAVVVVEHDPDLVAAADHVVELGPGCGPDGGLVVASGPPSVLGANPSTYTGRLLARAGPTAHGPRRPLSPGVTVRGASRHTLKDLDVEIPVGGLVVVAGVSGSGKSTLVLEVLAPSLLAAIRGGAPVGCRALDLHAPIAAVLTSDQETLAAGGGSTVATLAGVAEPLRRRFAATPEARARRLTSKAFSSSSPGGRCETCAGRGVVAVAMDLLPDVTVGCEACGGRRFSDAVLACRLDGRNLTDVLDAPVSDLVSWFAGSHEIAASLRALCEIGLSYLHLGQESTALSSGERQRLRLARLLASPRAGRTAVLLDEPTRGLGFEDVDRLLGSLGRLAAEGHLVVVVEHHRDVLAAADWLVELGSEGGARGGRIVRTGVP